MIYIFLITVWIAVLYLINKAFKLKNQKPTLKAKEFSKDEIERVRLSLSELSKIWGKKENLANETERESFNPKNKKYSIKLEELAPIYKKIVKDAKSGLTDINPAHERLKEFYVKNIKGNGSWTDEEYMFALELINFLDKKGDCPSVVKISKLDSSKREYDLLSKVSLLDHSIDVAEAIIDFYSSPLAIPDAICVALAHDLGKIPEFHGDFYSTGDHPELSARILRNEFQSFLALPEDEQNEILEAVSMHHKISKSELGRTLIQADQAARKKEVQEIEDLNYRENKKKQTIGKSQTQNDANPFDAPAEKSDNLKNPKAPVNDIETSVFDAPQEKKEPYLVPEKIDLSWFSVEEFISRISPYINKVEGNKFEAFSMPNGYVYFMTGLLTDTAVEMGIAAGDNYAQAIEFASSEEERKKAGHTLLNSIANLLKERDLIPSELCGKKYFGNKFIVKYKNPVGGKKEQNAFYTPFYSSVFSPQVSELEKDKPELIRNIESVEKNVGRKTDA